METGTADGGSALYLASVCDLLGTGRVITIDIEEKGFWGEERPSHSRIRYLLGSSADTAIVDQVKREAKDAERVMVVLDSNHSAAHVYAELVAYAPLVTTGGYLVIEDTYMNGHPLPAGPDPGPMEAAKAFLEEDRSF
jgi:cephalosporin hydroxylase